MLLAATVAMIAPAVPLHAQQAANYDSHQEEKPKASTTLTDGEIRRVDKDAKKLTIRHGPIQNLDMPEMTMVFQVKDPAMLDKVNKGDKIRFSAEKIDGVYTVTGIEAAKLRPSE